MSGGGLGIADLADIETIGGGAAGVVYSATDLKLDRRVAVRVFNPLTDEVGRDRFTRESQILASLSSHPNVVTIYDAGFAEENKPYLIMELIEGDDLATVLTRRGTLPWTEAADIALQICTGLEQAHRSGVLHRDLRPANVLMVGPAPKLTDFGISTSRHGAEGALRSQDPTVMEHRGPETFNGAWDERTDLYSLASMLYQMIDGNAPFHRPSDDSVDALRLRLTHEQPPGLAPEAAPAALSIFITAALAKEPFDRPQSADEFAHELRLIREGRTTGSTPSVLHGTGQIPAVADPTALGMPPPRPEVAPLAFSNEAAGEPSSASFAAAASVTQAGLPPVPAAHLAAPAIGGAPASEAVGVPAPPSFPSSQQPGEWTPPAGDGHTAVYSNFAPSTGPAFSAPAHYGDPAMPGTEQPAYGDQAALPLPAEEAGLLGDRPAMEKRSPVFLAAMAMIALGVLGLATVLAVSAFGSDDETPAAPALPDPDQPVIAGAQSEALAVEESVPSTTLPEAMEDSTTSAEVMEEATTTQTTEQRYSVPRVIGNNVETASQQLTDAGFQVLVVGRQSAVAPPGIVSQQKPDAGDLVTLPLTVTLYIPIVTELPAMAGRTADAVCLELRALSLTCTRILAHDDQVPFDSVISTQPDMGSPIVEGTTVQLTVSLGPVANKAIPETAGLTAEEARTRLTAAGFSSVSVANQESESVEKDVVVGTTPTGGTMQMTDQPVTVLVSSGPPAKVTIPMLAGLPIAEAEAALSDLGLTAEKVTQNLQAGDPNIGKVLSSAPEMNTEVAVGSTVTVTVGQETPADEGDGG